MLEFETAARRVADEAAEVDFVEFEIKQKNDEGEVVSTHQAKAYRPGDGQIAVLMSMSGKATTIGQAMSVILDFLNSILTPSDYHHIYNRLMDLQDPFGFDDVDGIVQGLVAHWSGRPTPPASGSSRSPKAGGQKSKQSSTKST